MSLRIVSPSFVVTKRSAATRMLACMTRLERSFARRKVVLASASPPGFFPPVKIDVTVNGQTYKGQLVGADKSTDLAVVKISAPSSILHPLTLANSDRVHVGDGVVAIGSPLMNRQRSRARRVSSIL